MIAWRNYHTDYPSLPGTDSVQGNIFLFYDMYAVGPAEFTTGECTDELILQFDDTTFAGGVNNLLSVNPVKVCYKAYMVSFAVNVHHPDYTLTDDMAFSLTCFPDGGVDTFIHNYYPGSFNCKNWIWFIPTCYVVNIGPQITCKFWSQQASNYPFIHPIQNPSPTQDKILAQDEYIFVNLKGRGPADDRATIINIIFYESENVTDFTKFDNVEFTFDNGTFTAPPNEILNSLMVQPLHYQPHSVLSITMIDYQPGYDYKFSINFFPDYLTNFVFVDTPQAGATEYLKHIANILITEHNMICTINENINELLIMFECFPWEYDNIYGAHPAFGYDPLTFPTGNIADTFVKNPASFSSGLDTYDLDGYQAVGNPSACS